MKYNCQNVSFEYRENSKPKRGGNGAVFNVSKLLDSNGNIIVGKFVVKIFDYDSSKTFNEKKLIRFKEEVKFLNGAGRSIDGVVDIVDYLFDEKKNLYLYLMPKLDKYEYTKDKIEFKIEKLIKIAKILLQIHNYDDDLKYSHRDIKPSNIMLRDGEPIVCDFGLIWDDQRESITDLNEPIGPRLILPPELVFHKDFDIDYRKSDIYLFAKLCWTYIREIDTGFPGPYLRSGDYFLESKRFNVKTLEPINELIESCTVDDFRKRPGLDFCIGKLADQLDIIKESIDPLKLNDYLSKEIINSFTSKNKSTKKEYAASVDMISKFLSQIFKNYVFKVVDRPNNTLIDFNFSNFKNVNKNLFVIYNFSGQGSYEKLYFNSEKIIFDSNSNSLTIKCKKIEKGIVSDDENNSKNLFAGDYTEIVFKY